MNEPNAGAEQSGKSDITPSSNKQNDASHVQQKSCCTKAYERWQRTKEKWKEIPADRKIELFVGIAIMIAAIVSACVAARQWSVMLESNRINSDAMIASNRAWIAPIEVVLTAPVIEGKKIKYRLSYQNTGHSPAEQTTFFGTQAGVTETPVEQYTLAPDPNSRGWIDNKTCHTARAQQRVHNWPSIYPFSQPNYTYDFESDDSATDNIVNGRVAKLTRGCFVYNTLTLTSRVSQYCFYLDPADWKFRRCAYGNDAN